MTVADLITRAAVDLQVISEGEVLSPQSLADGLSALNDWIDGLATQTLTVYTVTRTTWTLDASTSYTIGAGGDINIARPVNPQAVQNIGYVDGNFSPAVEVLLSPLLTDDLYASIPIKDYSDLYPTNFYYRPTFPLGTLIPYPIPSSSLLEGVIYTNTAVTEFTSTAQTVSLPPGYRRFFRSNLAIELVPVFKAEPTPALIKIATDSAADIKRANIRLVDLPSDAAGLFRSQPWSNIYTGAGG